MTAGTWSGSAPTCEGGSCMMSDLIYNYIYIACVLDHVVIAFSISLYTHHIYLYKLKKCILCTVICT